MVNLRLDKVNRTVYYFYSPASGCNKHGKEENSMPAVTSNYDKARDAMSTEFLRYDQARMIRKFSLDHDEDYIYVTFLNLRYRISRSTGRVECLAGPDAPVQAGYTEAMTIYDVLCCSRENCRPAHKFVSVSSLSSVMGGSLSEGQGFFQLDAELFDGRVDELRRACLKLSGRELSGGDAASEFELFPSLAVALRFWSSDDEFPASLQLLADANILDFMHYETLMFALSHLLSMIKEEMSA